MNKSFQIKVDPVVIEDLQTRLATTRWPDEVDNRDWKIGTNLQYLQDLCKYWQTEYNWEENEEYLNTFNHYHTHIGENAIHFIMEKGKGQRNIPILLIHGFPDSFVRFLKLIPLLTEERDGVAFDVIIPSLPGFGLSGKPTKPGMNPSRIATLLSQLMIDELGYKRFLVHGGDWGSSIAEQIAFQYPRNLFGMHLTDIPFHHLFSVPAQDLSPAEKDFLKRGQEWQKSNGGYAMVQSTAPQTLSYALNDSPAGLASWIIEKFYKWSDCDGKLENCYSRDELLTNLTLYWATQTINSSMRIYYEKALTLGGKAPVKPAVPTAVAIFPKDLVPAPRDFAERVFHITQWTEMPKGGHFAAMEQPELLVKDIRKFAKVVAIRKPEFESSL